MCSTGNLLLTDSLIDVANADSSRWLGFLLLVRPKFWAYFSFYPLLCFAQNQPHNTCEFIFWVGPVILPTVTPMLVGRRGIGFCLLAMFLFPLLRCMLFFLYVCLLCAPLMVCSYGFKKLILGISVNWNIYDKVCWFYLLLVLIVWNYQ